MHRPDRGPDRPAPESAPARPSTPLTLLAASLLAVGCGGPAADPSPGARAEALEPSEHVVVPAPVGALPASTSVSTSGTGRVRVPLRLPPARRGMGPRLGVAYDSDRGDGILGPGFTLTGLSSISRCARNTARDGTNAGVALDERDALCLDGERLLPIDPSVGGAATSGVEYRPEHDPTRRVLSYPGSVAGPARFEVYAGDGTIREYGGSGGQVVAPTTPTATAVSWLLRRVRDRRGNEWRIAYEVVPSGGDVAAEISEVIPVRIDYTAFHGEEGTAPAFARVELAYRERPDPRAGYRFGFTTARTRLLESITTWAADAPVLRYRFDHERFGSDAVSRLVALEECSMEEEEEVCKPPTRFDWARPGEHDVDGEDQVFDSRDVEGWAPVYSVGRMSGTTQLSTSPRAMVAMDFDGDGIDDVAYFDEPRYLDPGWTSRLHVRLGHSDPDRALQRVRDTGIESYPGAQLTPTDYDHDGRDDLIAISRDGVAILRSTGRALETIPTDLPLSYDWDELGTPGRPVAGGPVAVADMNGDGKDDLLVCGMTEDCSDVGGGGVTEIGVVAAFTGLIPFLCPFGLCEEESDPQAHADCRGRWYYAEGQAGGFAPWVDTGVADRCHYASLARPGDFDGDGRTEMLLTASADGASSATRVMSLEEDGFAEAPTPLCYASSYWECEEDLVKVAAPAHVADLNGDGNHDVIVHRTADDGAGGIHQVPFVAFGTGAREQPLRHLHDAAGDDPFWAGFTNLLIAPTARPPLRHSPPIPFDFTGDGRADVLQPAVRREAQTIQCVDWISTGCGVYGWNSGPIEAFVSDGYRLASQHPVAHWVPAQITYEGVTRRRTQFVLADANGDGARDMIQVLEEPEEAEPRSASVRVHYNVGGLPRHVVRVEDGLGRVEELDYAPLTSDVYRASRRCEYPVECVRDTRYVVARRRTDDGTRRATGALSGSEGYGETRYEYRDARLDREASAFAGFARVTTHDLRTGRVTQTDYDNRTRSADGWYVFAGLPRIRRTWVVSELPLGFEGRSSTYRSTVDVYDRTAMAFPDGVTIRSFLRRHIHREYEGDAARVRIPERPNRFLEPTRHVRTHYTHDPDFGQLAYRRVRYRDQGRDEEHWTPRTHRTGDWLLGLVESERRRSTTPHGTAERTLERSHDAYGDVEETVHQPGDFEAELRVSVLERDRFGNVARVLTEPAQRAPFETTVRHDATGVFVEHRTNAVGHETFAEHHPGLGVLLEQVDENGLAQRLYYDGFGRLVRARHPDGTETSRTYRESAAPLGGLEVETFTPGWDHHVVVRDRLGRTLEERERGFRGRWRRRMRAYDGLGNLVSLSEPTWEGVAPTRFTRWTHDPFGRVLSETTPKGDVLYRWYGANLEWQRDGRGHVTEREVGELGLPVRVELPTGATARYGYGPFDQLAEIVAPGGVTTTIEYDPLGRREALNDPNAGRITFAHDALGFVVREEHADGRWVEHEHDALGRRLARIDDEGEARFEWDTAPNGVGRLARASSEADEGELDYGYDALARPEWIALSTDGTRLEARRGYDRYGRLAHLRYLGGVQVDYALDDWGNLEAVRRDGVDLFRVDTVDARGRIEEERFANGVETGREYEPDSGRLERTHTHGVVRVVGTGATRAQSLVDLRYGYDASGNERWREDAVRGFDVTFEHDANDRLETATWSTGRFLRWAYDARGNLQRSPEGSLFRYGETLDDGTRVHPDRLVGIGADVYGYDDAGRMTSGPDFSATYTSFGLPRTLMTARGDTRRRYDAHRRLAVSEGPDGKSMRLGELIELQMGTDGQPTFRLHVPGLGRRLAEIVFTWDGARWNERTLFLHHDRLGSVAAVSDDSGLAVLQEYDPFGQRRPSATGASLFAEGVEQGFTGHRGIAGTDLVDMRGRIYDARVSRFLTPDPLVQAPHDPRSLNRYSYVWNDPLNMVDPSGFQAVPESSVAGYEADQAAATALTMQHLRDSMGPIHDFEDDEIIVENPATDEGPASYAPPSGSGSEAAAGEGPANTTSSGPINTSTSGASPTLFITMEDVANILDRAGRGAPYRQVDVQDLIREEIGPVVTLVVRARAPEPRYLPAPIPDLGPPRYPGDGNTMGALDPNVVPVSWDYSPYITLEEMRSQWQTLRSSFLASMTYTDARMAGIDADTAMDLARAAQTLEMGLTLQFQTAYDEHPRNVVGRGPTGARATTHSSALEP